MAGHSKWANIQHRKKAQDAKRGKLFTKLIREITVAARMGGPETDNNPRLRAAVDAALGGNMTKDTIERAIKKGAGDQDGASLEEVRYEGYGTNGVAIVVDCMTDNRNRTVAEVRHAFNKYGGNLGTDGSVAYLFSQKGVISFGPDADEDQVTEAAIEGGAEDVVINDDGSIEVLTLPEEFSDVKASIESSGLTSDFAEVTMIASTQVNLDTENSEKLNKLLDALDDLDDVQKVYSNANLYASE